MHFSWDLMNDKSLCAIGILSNMSLTAVLLYVVVASRQPSDIRPVLASYEGKDIPIEFIKRSQEHQRYIIMKTFFIPDACVYNLHACFLSHKILLSFFH